jgi:N-acetylglutamate synthase-like GNAT family acetyltransferase
VATQIRACGDDDFDAIHAIINDAAQAYAGVIPADLWSEPYMSRSELQHEIVDGVVFWGCEDRGALVGVMGLQDVDDVTLVRHAYVQTKMRNQGIGGALIRQLRATTSRPMLVGTWAAADWAIRLYERYGFRLVSTEEKNQLLRRHWSVPERQIETSVVLADERWLARPPE